MKAFLSFVAVLAALPAPAPAAQGQAWTAPEELARLGAEAIGACPTYPDAPAPTGMLLVGHGEWLAGLQNRTIPCTPRPELALRIARAAAGSRGSIVGPGHGLLAQLYERGIGVAADPAAARRHRRLEWLLRAFPSEHRPFATPEEEEAWLVRPETIAILERHAEAPDMGPARIKLARALFVRGRAADTARIESLAGPLSAAGDRPAQLLLARSALRHGDAAARARAVTTLRNHARYGDGAAEARALLMPIVRRQLRSRVPEERWEAIESLAAAAHGAEAAPLAELQRAVRAANGGRSPPTLRGPEVEAIRRHLRVPMTDEDYPARAIRGELQGRIALRGLIDPRGRLIYTEPLAADQEAVLLSTTRNIYARRSVPLVDLGRLRTAPYMWIELPGVRYVLPEPE